MQHPSEDKLPVDLDAELVKAFINRYALFHTILLLFFCSTFRNYTENCIYKILEQHKGAVVHIKYNQMIIIIYSFITITIWKYLLGSCAALRYSPYPLILYKLSLAFLENQVGILLLCSHLYLLQHFVALFSTLTERQVFTCISRRELDCNILSFGTIFPQI